MSRWWVRIGREWPLWIAAAALVSLLFIPRVTRISGLTAGRERRELADLRQEVETAPTAETGSRIARFLAAHPSSSWVVDARLLLADAALRRARAGTFPGVAAFEQAWTELARSRADRTPEVDAFRREIAFLLLEYDFPLEAEAKFRELRIDSSDPDLTLALGQALIRSGRLDEAAARVSDYLRDASPDRRGAGIRAQIALYREARRHQDILNLIAVELAETRIPAEKGLLLLERGRTFAALGRNMEAFASFDDAEQLLTDPLQRGAAGLRMAELYAREKNAECLKVCARLSAPGSPVAPLALLVQGVFELKSRPAAALDALRNGFSQVRRPRLLGDAGFDFPWVYGAVREAAERESDLERLARIASILAEVERLFPDTPAYGFDHAAVLLRARRFEEAADRYLALSASDRARVEDRERALLAAADACSESGLHRRAAALYLRFAEARPSANVTGLYRRAASLKRAGDADAALAAFETYVAKAGPQGLFTGPALLDKAALQRELGREADALATYDRVLKAIDVATSPSRDDWAMALMGRARVLLRLSRASEARSVLEEYLERYAPAPASLEAAWLLVAVAVVDGNWTQGLDRVHELELLARRIPTADRAPFAGLLREAQFAKAEFQFNLEDFGAAWRTYADASVLPDAPFEDRLRSLIGRGRALARLARKDEARRDYSKARAMIDTLEGNRRNFWELALNELAGDVQ